HRETAGGGVPPLSRNEHLMIVYASRVVGKDGPIEFHLGKELAQSGDLVAIERTYEAMEPQPDGTMQMSSVLSVQENGDVGWRPRSAPIGAFELAKKVQGFYLYAPGVR